MQVATFIGCALMSVAMVYVSLQLPSWIAWLPAMIGANTLLGLALILLYVVLAWLIKHMVKCVSIRLPPGSIYPIASAQDELDPARVSIPVPAVPAVRDQWSTMTSDEQALLDHSRQLERCRQALDRQFEQAVQRFERDRQTLLSQQRSVLRRAFRAGRHLRRIRGLPAAALSTDQLPQLERIRLPAEPRYLTPAEFRRMYRAVPRNAGVALARLAAPNGSISGASVLAATVATGVLAIRAKAMISKAHRAAEHARGLLLTHRAEAETTVALLRVAHHELLMGSWRLYDAAADLDRLTRCVEVLPSGVTELGALTSEQQEQVTELWYWVMSAGRLSRDAIA